MVQMESKIEVSVPQQEGKAEEQRTGQRPRGMVMENQLSAGVWLPRSLTLGLLCPSVWQTVPLVPVVESLYGHRGGFHT